MRVIVQSARRHTGQLESEDLTIYSEVEVDDQHCYCVRLQSDDSIPRFYFETRSFPRWTVVPPDARAVGGRGPFARRHFREHLEMHDHLVVPYQ